MANENKSTSPDGAIAVQYISDQLQASRSSLQKTRMISVISIVIVAAYMTYVASGLVAHFEPTSAATIAKNLISERVEASATDLSQQIKDGIPSFLQQLPEYALKQIPAARMELETHIEATLSTAAKASSLEVEKHFDAFLELGKDDIKKVIQDGQNLDIVRQLGPGLEKEMLSYLKMRDAGQESIQDKFDHALKDIDAMAARLQRLAKAKDLTPEEKRARRAIAVLLKKADWAAVPGLKASQ